MIFGGNASFSMKLNLTWKTMKMWITCPTGLGTTYKVNILYDEHWCANSKVHLKWLVSKNAPKHVFKALKVKCLNSLDKIKVGQFTPPRQSQKRMFCV